MAKHVLTIVDKSGRRLPGCTGSTSEIAVYSDDELQRRLAEAKKHPEWRVTHRPAPEAR